LILKITLIDKEFRTLESHYELNGITNNTSFMMTVLN